MRSDSILRNTLGISLALFFTGYFVSTPIGQIFGRFIRLEDLSFPLLLLLFPYVIKSFQSASLRLMLFMFLGVTTYGAVITYVGIATGTTDLRGIFYIIKELQFVYAGACLYAYFKPLKDARLLIGIIIGLIIINCVWASLQQYAGLFLGHYGVSAIGLDGAAAASAAVFLFGFLFGVSGVVLSQKKWIFSLVAAWSLVSLFMVASRTPILSAGVFLFLCGLAFVILFFVDLYRVNPVKLTVGVVLLFPVVVIGLAFGFVRGQLLDVPIERMSRFCEGAEIRAGKSVRILENWAEDPLRAYFGYGKGAYEAFSAEGFLGVDSQAVRFLLELGVVGSFLYCILLVSLVSIASINFKTNQSASTLYLSFLASFVAMYFSYDVMIISRYGYLFWLATFWYMAALARRKI